MDRLELGLGGRAHLLLEGHRREQEGVAAPLVAESPAASARISAVLGTKVAFLETPRPGPGDD